jgi:YVTN family beta-propeller protein
MQRAFLVFFVVCTLSSSAFSQTRQQVPATRFWNLTPFILSEFNLAPAGTTNWGPNQCKNDRDGTVSPNERLRITDTTPGIYDARLKDTTGTGLLRAQSQGRNQRDFLNRGTRAKDESKLLVANGFGDDVTVIDARTQKAIVSVTVGRIPWGIVVDE